MVAPRRRALRIALCHPDLGIGGAERLAVDAALELRAQGHHVHVFTAHHDRNHCFEETIDGVSTLISGFFEMLESVDFPDPMWNNGTSGPTLTGNHSSINYLAVLQFAMSIAVFSQTRQFPVTVYGNFLPRHVFYRLHALCAYIRCLYVAICMVLLWPTYDVIFADQVSAVIPVLKLKRSSKILFYCHFPDMLLAQHTTRLRKLYRAPLNWIEESTTGLADCVLVNSEYTASTFGATFSRLQARGLHPAVLYPAVDIHQFRNPAEPISYKSSATCLPGLPAHGHVFLSINRFERKKNIALAISAFALLIRQQENAVLEGVAVPGRDVRLAIAGGYDPRLAENREYLQELESLALEEGVASQVVFKPSCSTAQKNALLAACICVIYTPTNEHFGIVPLEAMASQRPVVACNSGGPKESVQQGTTGFLCEPTPESFASAMSLLLRDPQKAEIMGQAAREHVERNFSRQVFGERLNNIIYGLVETRS